MQRVYSVTNTNRQRSELGLRLEIGLIVGKQVKVERARRPARRNGPV